MSSDDPIRNDSDEDTPAESESAERVSDTPQRPPVTPPPPDPDEIRKAVEDA